MNFGAEAKKKLQEQKKKNKHWLTSRHLQLSVGTKLGAVNGKATQFKHKDLWHK